jgi:hypothetical protein
VSEASAHTSRSKSLAARRTIECVLRDVLGSALTLVVRGIGVGLVLAVLRVRLVDPSWYPMGGVEPLVYTVSQAPPSSSPCSRAFRPRAAPPSSSRWSR